MDIKKCKLSLPLQSFAAPFKQKWHQNLNFPNAPLRSGASGFPVTRTLVVSRTLLCGITAACSTYSYSFSLLVFVVVVVLFTKFKRNSSHC